VTGAGPQLAPEFVNGVLPRGRSPLAHLLHALNQPLTGLQCSLELAMAGARPTDQYVRTLREGLELTGRMRILVEAVRELADLQQSDWEGSDSEEAEPFLLDALLRDSVNDLLPVAEAKGVHFSLASTAPLPVRAGRRHLATLLFRSLESALSLTRRGGDFRITATPDRAQACLALSWNQGPPPEHSPFSRQELGLLIAQAGWERAGAEWTQERADTTQTCTVRLPLASLRATSQPRRLGDLK
jgi:signal transduction histidine kinase